MRFIEFADPKGITTTAAEAEELLKQLQRLLPGPSTDDPAPSELRTRKQPSVERRKLFDAL
jgi:hypothetical protein